MREHGPCDDPERPDHVTVTVPSTLPDELRGRALNAVCAATGYWTPDVTDGDWWEIRLIADDPADLLHEAVAAVIRECGEVGSVMLLLDDDSPDLRNEFLPPDDRWTAAHTLCLTALGAALALAMLRVADYLMRLLQ